MSPGTPLFAISDTLTDGGGAELARRLDWSCTQGATSRGRFDEGFGAISGKPEPALCFVFFLAELVPLSSSKSARFSIVAAGTDKESFLVFLLVVSWRAASLVAVEMSDGAETLELLALVGNCSNTNLSSPRSEDIIAHCFSPCRGSSGSLSGVCCSGFQTFLREDHPLPIFI